MYSLTVSMLAIALLSFSTTEARSFPRGESCGVTGYDSHTDAYFYDTSGMYAGYTKCSERCSKDSTCQSFGYDSTSLCMHFNVPVAGNVDQDDSSPEIYYDRGCIATSTSTGSSTPSSSTKPSKTTTVGSTQRTKSTTLSSTITTPEAASSTTMLTSTTKATTTSSTAAKSTSLSVSVTTKTTSSSVTTSSTTTKTTSSNATTSSTTTTTKSASSSVTTSSSTTTTTKSASSSATTSSTTTKSASSSATTSSTTTKSASSSATTSSTTTKSASSSVTTQLATTSTTTKAVSSTSTTAKALSSTSTTSTTTEAVSSTSTTSTITKDVSSTSTTTKAVSSTSSTKTINASSSTSSAVVIPSGCNVPAAYTISSFSWFNSTHNLDCVTGPDVGDGTGCIKTDANGNTVWCNPKTDTSCTSCGINVCSTGLPPQPLGYGPPDDVKFTFADGATCEQLNPAVVHRYEVGNGYVNCGSSADFMNFYGSSNDATNVGRVEINGYSVQCADGQYITPYYNTNFDIQCTRDAGRNATCTTPKSFSIPLVRFTKG